jgi:hypothetical protein
MELREVVDYRLVALTDTRPQTNLIADLVSKSSIFRASIIPG